MQPLFKLPLPNFYFFASQIAAINGLDSFKSKEEATIDYVYNNLNKVSSENAKLFENNKLCFLVIKYYVNKITVELDEIVNSVVSHNESAQTQNVREIVTTAVAKMMLFAEQNYKLFRDSRNANEKLKCTLESTIYCRRGTKLESIVLNTIQDKYGCTIQNRNVAFSKKSELFTVYGRIDGSISGPFDGNYMRQSVVVELKCRTTPNVRNGEMRTSDIVQCQMYMYLTGFKQCYFFEHYSTGSIVLTIVDYDSEMVNNLLVQLKKYSNELGEMTRGHIDEILEKYFGK